MKWLIATTLSLSTLALMLATIYAALSPKVGDGTAPALGLLALCVMFMAMFTGGDGY